MQVSPDRRGQILEALDYGNLTTDDFLEQQLVPEEREAFEQ
jgi:hypothetical protein